jgi:hypothetical protein
MHEIIRVPTSVYELSGDVRLTNPSTNDLFVYTSGFWTNNSNITINSLTVISGINSGSGSFAYTNISNVFTVPQYLYGSGNSRFEIKLSTTQSSSPFQIFASNGTTNLFSVSTAGAVVAASYAGTGSAITSLNGSNVTTGTIANSRTTASTVRSLNTLVLRDALGGFAASGVRTETLGVATDSSDEYPIDIMWGQARMGFQDGGQPGNLIFRAGDGGYVGILVEYPEDNYDTIAAKWSTSLFDDLFVYARGIINVIEGKIGINTGVNAPLTSDLVMIGNSRFEGNITIASGTGQFIGNGSGIYELDARNITYNTVATARLGTGTANSASFLRGDQTWQPLSGITTSAGGSNTQVQYNDSNTFAGNSSFVFNKANGLVTANGFSGSGNLLTNVHATISDDGLTSATGTLPLTLTLNSKALTGSISVATASTSGYLIPADWNTFNNKVSSSITISATLPLTGGGDLSTNRTFSIPKATSLVSGYLGADDWSIFNAKVGAASGSNTQVQFNDSGTFNGQAGFTYSKSTNRLTVGEIYASGTGLTNVPDSALSANIPLLNATRNTFTGSLVADNIIDTISFAIDGGNLTLVSGIYGLREVQASGIIVAVTLASYSSGTCIVDFTKNSYANFPTMTSITASSIPAIVSGYKYQDTTLSGWSKVVNTGDFIGCNINGTPSGITRVFGFLKIKRN